MVVIESGASDMTCGLKIPCGPSSGIRTPSNGEARRQHGPRQNLSGDVHLRTKPLERRQPDAVVDLPTHEPMVGAP